MNNPKDEPENEIVSLEIFQMAEELRAESAHPVLCVSYRHQSVAMPNAIRYGDVGFIDPQCGTVTTDGEGCTTISLSEIESFILVWPSKKNVEYRQRSQASVAQWARRVHTTQN